MDRVTKMHRNTWLVSHGALALLVAALCFLSAAHEARAQGEQAYPSQQGQGYTPAAQDFRTQASNGQYSSQMSQISSDIITTNTPNIEGYRITSYKGVIEGVAVRQPTWGQNMAANMQQVFGGGSLEAYGEMCEQSRVQAYKNLIQRARGIGANAIVNIRFDSESLQLDNQRFATASVCYGTAVSIEPATRR